MCASVVSNFLRLGTERCVSLNKRIEKEGLLLKVDSGYSHTLKFILYGQLRTSWNLGNWQLGNSLDFHREGMHCQKCVCIDFGCPDS